MYIRGGSIMSKMGKRILAVVLTLAMIFNVTGIAMPLVKASSQSTNDVYANSLREETVATVEVSSENSYWNKSHLIDGVLENDLWASAEYNTSTYQNIDEWAKFTLSGNVNVHCVDIYPRTSKDMFPSDFSVSVSSDGTEWETVKTYTDYDHPSLTEPLRVYVNRENTKYVKINFTEAAFDAGTRYYVQIAEVKIYSLPAYTSMKKVEISAVETKTAHTSWNEQHLIDGVYTNDLWSSDTYSSANVDEYAKFTLPEEMNLYYLDLYPRTSGSVNMFPTDFTVSVSSDGSAWETVATYASYAHPNMTDPLRILINKENVRFVKIDFTKAVLEGGTRYYVQLAEVEMFSYTNLENSLLKKEVISVVETATEHSAWGKTHLVDGVLANDLWSSNTYSQADVNEYAKFTLTTKKHVQYIDLYPRTNAALTMFPSDFTVSVSSDNSVWETVATYSGYTHASTASPLRITINKDDVQYVKVDFTKAMLEGGSRYYVQLAEVMIYSMNVMTAAEAGELLTIATDATGQQKIVMSNVTNQFEKTIVATNPAGIIAADGSYTRPEADTTVTVTVQLVNKLDSSDKVSVQKTILIKSQKTLENEEVAKVAKTVNFIPYPEPDATKITLPTLDGYTITIAESNYPNVVSTEGMITRSKDTTYAVRLTLNVKNNATGAVGKTEPLLVPIYKTYVAPTMTAEEVEKAHADYESMAYGIFVHYISEYASGSTKYIDGTNVLTVDDLADHFDAAQFAKDMDEFGVEYVLLTMWHGDARTLFPSMTNERWRDARRSDDTIKKSYSDRDVIADLLDELDKYGIDLHLYTHPCDGHDFVAEDQALTGWNDATGNYATWNQYINELYYEVCERYGTRIKGLWFDGVYNHVKGEVNQNRLRETCLAFNPAMILTMNTGFTEGNINPAPEYTHPDYRAWEVNRVVDFEEDMKYSRYQSAIVIGGAGWWANKAQSVENANVQPAEEIFRYLVAMSSISTHGGFAASTGFYPARETDEMNGDYWMKGIREALLGVGEYLEPVAESIKNTNIGKAYPTVENQTISELEWGVSTESRDGKYVYLHVLQAPSGQTLTLPKPADGSVFESSAQVLLLDGTTVTATVAENGEGYKVTLPTGTSWSEVDTVIKLVRSTTAFEGYSVVAYTGTEANSYIGNSAPQKDGMLFAGWYTDIRCGAKYAVTGKVAEDATVYAKFVSEDVMKLLFQVTKGTSAESENADLRMISSVDGLDYSSVGFKLIYNDGQKDVTKTHRTSTVYEQIVSSTEGNEFEFGPKIVGVDSKYFITATLRGVTDFDREYYIRPCWTTFDGVTIYGMGRYVKVSDSYSNLVNIPVKGDATVQGVTASERRYRDGAQYANVMVSVSDVTTMSAATKYEISDGTSYIVRNYYAMYNGTADTSWYTTDTTADTYVLVSAAELYGLASLSASNTFAEKTIYLASDIELNKGTASASGWTPATTGGTQYNWTNIGTSSKYFSGTFDGQGYTIRGLYHNGTAKNCGMFAYTAPTSVIRNYTLENSYITSTNICVGSIVGQFAGTMDTVKSSAYVSVNNAIVGGLIGYVYDNNTTTMLGKAKINNCWFDGEVISGAQAGGIVGTIHGKAGYISEDVTITNCLNTGKITSSATGTVDIGGIVGTAWGGILKMTDCLNVGEIVTSSTSWNGSILGRYRSGVTNTTVYIDNVFATTESSTNGTANIQSTTDTTVLKNAITTVAKEKLTGRAAYSNATLDFTKYWAIDPDGTPILASFADDEEGLVYDLSWYGESYGTKDDPFELRDVNDLYGFAFLTTQMNFAGKTVTLTDDMDLTGLSWTPIGTSAKPFAGTFDGRYHTISGITLESSEHYVGVFGMTEIGSLIKNLRVEDCSFCVTGTTDGYAFLGSVAGEIRGNIENVYSNATITSDCMQVGGIVGRANSLATNGVRSEVNIKNCWFDGTVAMTGSTGRYAGGIIGSAIQGIINVKDCLFTGTLSCEAVDTGLHVGGLVGNEMNALTMNVTNFLSAGTIDVDYAVCVGSVFGRIQVATSEYNLNNVYATTECYATSIYNTSGKAPNGTVNAVAESTLYGETGASALGDAWVAVEDDTPILKLFQ